MLSADLDTFHMHADFMELGGEASESARNAANSSARPAADARDEGGEGGALGAPAAALLATEASKLELEARLRAYAPACALCCTAHLCASTARWCIFTSVSVSYVSTACRCARFQTLMVYSRCTCFYYFAGCQRMSRG